MIEKNNIVEQWVILGPGKYWLLGSKKFKNNEMIELPSFGALLLELVGRIVVLRHYSTANTPIDCLTGFPAETLHKDGAEWEQFGISNGSLLYSKSIRWQRKDEIVVETHFGFPEYYIGPKYIQRKIWFNAKTLLVIKVEMLFENGKTDTGIFSYHNQLMQVDWTLTSGYLNQVNVNFL